MKYLKIFLGILLVLIILFFVKGMIAPKVSYESTITVNKSAAESWAVMSDQSKMSKWIKGFLRSELVSGTENTPGAVSHVYVDNGGKEIMMKETIVSVNESDHLKMKFSMDMMDMDYEIRFKEEGANTVITTSSETIGNGMFNKSIVSFMSSLMKTQEDENLSSLKKLIEENTTDYFPVPESVTDEISENE